MAVGLLGKAAIGQWYQDVDPGVGKSAENVYFWSYAQRHVVLTPCYSPFRDALVTPFIFENMRRRGGGGCNVLNLIPTVNILAWSQNDALGKVWSDAASGGDERTYY